MLGASALKQHNVFFDFETSMISFADADCSENEYGIKYSVDTF